MNTTCGPLEVCVTEEFLRWNIPVTIWFVFIGLILLTLLMLASATAGYADCVLRAIMEPSGDKQKYLSQEFERIKKWRFWVDYAAVEALIGPHPSIPILRLSTLRLPILRLPTLHLTREGMTRCLRKSDFVFL